MLDAWPFPPAADQTTRGLDLLRAFCRRRDASTIEKLSWDFNRLFVGPGKMLAPPWESVYVSKTGLTFQESTLQVRELYRHFDLEVPSLHREPDDHLALELAFVAHLSELAATADSRDDTEQLDTCHRTQQRFLSQHLLGWAPECLALVETHAETDYYRGAARLTLGTLKESARLCGVDPAR